MWWPRTTHSLTLRESRCHTGTFESNHFQIFKFGLFYSSSPKNGRDLKRSKLDFFFSFMDYQWTRLVRSKKKSQICRIHTVFHSFCLFSKPVSGLKQRISHRDSNFSCTFDLLRSLLPLWLNVEWKKFWSKVPVWLYIMSKCSPAKKQLITQWTAAKNVPMQLLYTSYYSTETSLTAKKCLSVGLKSFQILCYNFAT